MLDALKITSRMKAVPTGFPAIKPSFNDYTWAEIKQISDAELWDLYGFELGQTKTVNISDGRFGGAGNVECYIVDFNHNYKLEGKGISLQFGSYNGAKIIMGKVAMKFNAGWSNSNGRKWCNTFFEALPADLKSVIKETTKYSNNKQNTTIDGITATKDKIFVPSVTEFGLDTRHTLNHNEEIFQTPYAFYKVANPLDKYEKSNLSVVVAYNTRTVSNGYANEVAIASYSSSDKMYYSYSTSSAEAHGLVPTFVI